MNRPRVRTFIAALAGLFVLSGGAFGGGAPKAPRVLLITLDTTRADRLGCYGYAGAATPHLDGLAGGGVRFANAYSHAPLTLPSHCSILTGTSPLYHQVRNNGFYYLDEQIPTLAELFKKAGYATGAFVSSFTLDSRFGLARGFDVYEDGFEQGEILKNFRSERKAAEVADVFLPWLARNSQKPFFAWLHFYDPHLPYDPPPPFAEAFSGHRYDGEIAYMDSVIGRVLKALDGEGLLDQTLIVVAGDHGEALGDRKEIDHGLFLYDNTMRVPLLFSWKAGLAAGEVVPARVRLMDVMPTILELTGIARPKTLQGLSLKPWMTGRRKDDLPAYIETFYPRENFGWSELRGLVDGSWKYIQAPRPELYDLKNDPREEKNLFLDSPDSAKKMAEQLQKTIKETARPAPPQARRVSSEEAERLRSLGYLGGSRTEAGGDKILPDPKDKIDDYLTYYRAHLMEGEGRLDAALDLYREVLRANPDVPSNYVSVGFLLMKLDRPAEAVGLLEEARDRYPDSPIVLSRLLTFYLRVERWDDAIATGQRLLDVQPRDFEAHFLSGSAYGKVGKWSEALDQYRQALEIEPENPTLRQRYAYALAAVGRPDEALESYGRLKQEFPEDISLDLEIGRIHESMGQMEKARNVYRSAVDRHPHPDTYHAYAMFLGRTNELREAVHWLELYLKTAPETDAARKALAQAKLAEWKNRLKIS
jgi:arylsulfatase A-like enzyme